jgi:hypothetical protein
MTAGVTNKQSCWNSSAINKKVGFIIFLGGFSACFIVSAELKRVREITRFQMESVLEDV